MRIPTLLVNNNLISVVYGDEIKVQNVKSEIANDDSIFCIYIDDKNYNNVSVISLQNNLIKFERIIIDTAVAITYQFTADYEKLDQEIHYVGFDEEGYPEFLLLDQGQLTSLLFDEKKKIFYENRLSIPFNKSLQSASIIGPKTVIVSSLSEIKIYEDDNEINHSSINTEDFKPIDELIPFELSGLTSIIDFNGNEVPLSPLVLLSIENQKNILKSFSSDIFGRFNLFRMKRINNKIIVFIKSIDIQFENVDPIFDGPIKVIEGFEDQSRGITSINYHEIASINVDDLAISVSSGEMFNVGKIKFKFQAFETVEMNLDRFFNVNSLGKYVYEKFPELEIRQVINQELSRLRINSKKISGFENIITSTQNDIQKAVIHQLKSEDSKTIMVNFESDTSLKLARLPKAGHYLKKFIKLLAESYAVEKIIEAFDAGIEKCRDEWKEYQKKERERQQKLKEKKEREKEKYKVPKNAPRGGWPDKGHPGHDPGNSEHIG